MARKRKPGARELLADVLREELRELDIEVIDHTGDYALWKYDPVRFIDEHQLAGGPLHPEQRVILEAAVLWELDDENVETYDHAGIHPYFAEIAIRKTRQVGMSWLFCSLELWTLLFWPTYRINNSSRKEREVDDGGGNSTVKSLHGRIRFMYDHKIPAWLRRLCPLEFKFLMILTGKGGFAAAEAATPDVGRGGTYDLAFLDEFAHVDWSKQVWASISQACKQGKIVNSTPRGRGNEYARLVLGAKQRGIRVLDYHWTKHPVYARGLYFDNDGNARSPWYDQECSKIGDPVMVAQELDMSFDQSREARVYPTFIRAKHFTGRNFLRNDFTPLFCGWDYGMAGSTSLVLAQLERYEDRAELQVLAEYENTGLHIDAYVPIVRSWESLYGFIQHVGDPAGLSKNITSGKGPIQALAEHGIYTEAPHYFHHEATDGIRVTRRLLAGSRFGGPTGTQACVLIDESCERLAECLENTHYPVDTNGERKPGHEMAQDNEWTHMSDAFRYLCHYVARNMLGHLGDVEQDEEVPQAFTHQALTREF